MANSMSGNPLIMDTATATWAANALPGTQALAVFIVIWHNPTTAAHTFSIVDGAGQVILPGIAVAANVGSSIQYSFTKPIVLSKANGWRLSQISSGTLYIYF